MGNGEDDDGMTTLNAQEDLAMYGAEWYRAGEDELARYGLALKDGLAVTDSGTIVTRWRLRDGDPVSREDQQSHAQQTARFSIYARLRGFSVSNRRTKCLRTVAGTHCRRTYIGGCKGCNDGRIFSRALDHSRMWGIAGRYVLTGDPYDLTADNFDELREICSGLNLEIVIDEWPSPYLPGDAIHIEVRKGRTTP